MQRCILRGLTGLEADGLFLQLMIAHHRMAVVMGQAALAQSIVDAQASEIALMQTLLQQKGFPPVPEEEIMNHGTLTP